MMIEILVGFGLAWLLADKLDIGMVRLLAGIVGLLMLMQWADPVMFEVWLYELGL